MFSLTLFVLLSVLVLRSLLRALLSPLRKLPGPLPTRFTRLYYAHAISTGTFHHTNLALHKRYGPVVRLAPNMYSLDSTAAIKPIYSVSSKFTKSAWYDGWRHPDPDKNSLFPQRDVRLHAETRRLFQGMFSLSALVAYESYVDECAEIFARRLEEFANDERTVNMGHWLQCYAFDVIGDITYSERFGFLDAGEDLGGMMKALWKSMWYSSIVGVYHEWHPRIYGMMEKVKGSGPEARTYILKIVGKMVMKRKTELAANTEDKATVVLDDENAPADFLSKIMKAHEKNPEKVTDFHVFMMGIANVFAGSDTTAVSLSAILYYLLKNPRTMNKLREEIEEVEKAGRWGKVNLSFKESLEMPYLQAVMKEAMRLHSATGLPLWRDVPEGGAELCGTFFPAGTVVGINTWVAHYNESVFGKDAAEFRPERWIEAEKEGGERARAMETYYFPFGLGSRTCLGKHISILEMSKLVPQMVRRYDFELENAEREWTTQNFWFVKPVDFQVKVKLRGLNGGKPSTERQEWIASNTKYVTKQG